MSILPNPVGSRRSACTYRGSVPYSLWGKRSSLSPHRLDHSNKFSVGTPQWSTCRSRWSRRRSSRSSSWIDERFLEFRCVFQMIHLPYFAFRWVVNLVRVAKMLSFAGRLKDKVAVVTGSGSGIGRAVAVRLAQEGAKVVCPDVNHTTATETAQIITDAGLTAIAPSISVDVSNEENVKDMYAEVDERFGGVDVLVANAGIQIVKPTHEFDLESWKKVIAINLDGQFLCSKYALQRMYENENRGRSRGGSIILIGSAHSKTASVLKAPYCSAKHGLVGLCRVIAKEGARQGVSINMVNPGFVETPLVMKQIPEQAKALGISEEEVVQKIMLKDTIDGKFTTLEEVADAVAYFAGFPGTALSGQTLNVTHGWVME